MGLIDNFGRVASMYMEEKEQLQKAEEKRKRTRTGHGFWPHEVLRDSIIFASMLFDASTHGCSMEKYA